MYLGLVALKDGSGIYGSPQYWLQRIYGGGTWTPTAPVRTPITPIISRPVVSIPPRPAQPPLRIVPKPPAPAPIARPIVTPPTIAPKSPAANPNAGTPVPAGYPTNQLFVNSDGSFWEHGPNGWVNVGTPYGTGASATPPAPPPSPGGGSTAAPGGTTAPGPVNVSVAAPSSGYQEIFDWLQEDTLAAYFGLSFPNWIVAGAAALIGYKVTQEHTAGRR